MMPEIVDKKNGLQCRFWEVDYGDGRWLLLAEGRVQLWALVIATLNIRVQLPGVSEVDLREVGCEDGRCMEVPQDRVQRRAL